MRLAVVILNYRRAELTLGCLESLVSEVEGRGDRIAVVVDNRSDDGSADLLEQAIAERGWDWVQLVRSPVNGGFAAGNNLGMGSIEADLYLLLNSDARVRPGAIDLLIEAAGAHPKAGLLGPRLEDPDGTAQVSCFRFRTPMSELLHAAATGPISRLFDRFVVAMGVFDQPTEPPWLSFACVLVRREVFQQVGGMDESYFMYFEDIDYARRARAAGWTVRHVPEARVVHLRGGTSSVKSALRERRRVPRYYYEARTRYFAKHYGGRLGLLLTNFLWSTGRTISFLRELFGRPGHTCAQEWRDNWINFLNPLRPPSVPGGGDL